MSKLIIPKPSIYIGQYGKRIVELSKKSDIWYLIFGYHKGVKDWHYAYGFRK